MQYIDSTFDVVLLLIYSIKSDARPPVQYIDDPDLVYIMQR